MTDWTSWKRWRDWISVWIRRTSKDEGPFLMPRYIKITGLLNSFAITQLWNIMRCVHPWSKVIGIFFAMSKDGFYFQCIDLKFVVLHDEVFCIYCEKISWVYVIASRLCEHSNVVKFEKRAAKTPQHGHRYGNIIILYDTINTYEYRFCYNWLELCSSNKLLDFSITYCFLVKYAIKYQTSMSSYLTPCYADMQRAVPSDPGAGTSSYWVMPSYTAIKHFSIFWGRAQARLIYFPISVAMFSMMFHRLI